MSCYSSARTLLPVALWMLNDHLAILLLNCQHVADQTSSTGRNAVHLVLSGGSLPQAFLTCISMEFVVQQCEIFVTTVSSEVLQHTICQC